MSDPSWLDSLPEPQLAKSIYHYGTLVVPSHSLKDMRD
jgi:hypothetical protein